MPGPALLQLSRLLTEAPKGDPLAKAALPAAEQEFMTPPPTVGMSDEPEDISSELNPQPFSAGAQSTAPPSIPSAHNTQQSGGDEGGFFKSDQFGDIAKLGISGLLGAGLGKLTGVGGNAVAAEALRGGVKDIQEKQAMALKREQAAWEDAYKQAQQLPQEIYNQPEKFKELIASQQALMKDLADGKVNNTKTLSSFLTAKAMAGDELHSMQMEKEFKDKMDFEKRAADEQFMRKNQQIESVYRIAADRMATPEERSRAQMQINEFEKEKNAQAQRDREYNLMMEHNRRVEEQQREENSLRRQGLAQQERVWGERLASQERVAGEKQRGAQVSNWKRNFQNELNGRLKEGMERGLTYDQVQDELVRSHGQEIKELAGIGDAQGGNIQIGGQTVQLSRILSMDPAAGEWDADGTPSQKGWDKILRMAHQQIMRQPDPLALSNLQGVYEE